MKRVLVIVALFLCVAALALAQTTATTAKSTAKPVTPSTTAAKPASTGTVKTSTSDQSKGTWHDYFQARNLIVADLKKANDPVFMAMFREDNKKKKVLRNKVFVAHPDIAKMQDPKAQNDAVMTQIRELRKAGDKDYMDFWKARQELDKYLMTKSPTMKAAFDKMDPAFRDQYDPTAGNP